MRFISFIIPCYNSEHTLKRVIEEIDQTVSTTDKYEIVLVNDHSKDNVWEIIEGMTNQRTNIVGVRFCGGLWTSGCSVQESTNSAA